MSGQLISKLVASIVEHAPRESLTRALGRAADKEKAYGLAQFIAAYCRAYHVELDECVEPPAGFASFNDFFTRALKPHARPLAESWAVCPADGVVADSGPISASSEFFAKSSRYTVQKLLGGALAAVDADAFAGGTFAVHYLSPRDYHRVHASVEGEVVGYRHIPGFLYPVNRIGTDNVPALFSENERLVVMQHTDRGPVATVLVGALVVGGIALAFDDVIVPQRLYENHSVHLRKGEELGRFLVGSTVVMLYPNTSHVAPAKAGDFLHVRSALPVHEVRG